MVIITLSSGNQIACERFEKIVILMRGLFTNFLNLINFSCDVVRGL